MDDYVSKPIQKQELLETVTRWIGHSATAEEAPVPRLPPSSSIRG